MVRKSGAGRKSKKKKSGTHSKPGSSKNYQVTSEYALAFIRKMQKRFPDPLKTEEQKAELQKYLTRFTDRQLKAVGSRIQSDLMLRPPRTIRPADFEKTRRGLSVSRRKPK
jgi:hypothetical protein